MKTSGASEGQPASELISKRIADLGDWRGETLGRMRRLIKETDPDVVEEWKWMGTPVWSHDGILCTGESYKSIVKLTFAKGAYLPDPTGLFNSSLDGNTRRAIDIHEGEAVDEAAFKALVRQAIALNGGTKPKKPSEEAREEGEGLSFSPPRAAPRVTTCSPSSTPEGRWSVTASAAARFAPEAALPSLPPVANCLRIVMQVPAPGGEHSRKEGRSRV